MGAGLQAEEGLAPRDDEGGPAASKSPLSLARLADISVGMLGVQIVWGLQNVNTTRIFQNLGAQIADLPILWIAAPITGLLVQPIVGHLSDRTSSRWGQRRPFLVAGGICSAASLAVMVSATTLTEAIVALWILTASVNIAMQPLRALMADLLPPDQRSTGFSVQVVFIGAGAIFASALPWMLAHWTGLGNGQGGTGVPAVVRHAYWIGAGCLLLTVSWTVFRVKEPTTPGRSGSNVAVRRRDEAGPPHQLGVGLAWTAGGVAIAAVAWHEGLRREIYMCAAICVAFGIARGAVAAIRRKGGRPKGLLEIVEDLIHMPPTLRRLSIVQFFTWFGLFAMWVYAVPAVAARLYLATDVASAAYEEGANAVGVLFAMYDGVAVAAAMTLPWLARRRGLPQSHAICLALGAAGLAGLATLTDPTFLWLPALGIGCAWASILSVPYAMVAEAAPPGKVGVYMGLHNIFLVLPQLVAASTLGIVMDRVFHGEATKMLALAACSTAIAALASLGLFRAQRG